MAQYLSGTKVSKLNPLVTGLSSMCDRSRSSEQNANRLDVSCIARLSNNERMARACEPARACRNPNGGPDDKKERDIRPESFCSEERLRSHLGIKPVTSGLSALTFVPLNHGAMV